MPSMRFCWLETYTKVVILTGSDHFYSNQFNALAPKSTKNINIQEKSEVSFL